jgi:hypothetical protein
MNTEYGRRNDAMNHVGDARTQFLTVWSYTSFPSLPSRIYFQIAIEETAYETVESDSHVPRLRWRSRCLVIDLSDVSCQEEKHMVR